MNKKELAQLCGRWYWNNKIKYAMLPFLKNKELALLPPIWAGQANRSVRTARAHNVQQLDIIRKWTSADSQEILYQYYASIATYEKGVIKTTLNINERIKQTEEWKKNHYKTMKSYDFFIDIDGTDETEYEFTKESARNIKGFLDYHTIPYQLRYSGNGFHFLIPHEFMTNTHPMNPHGDIENIYQFYKSIAKGMYEKYSELIDIGIYDSRRVIKIPFTLALYEDRVRVCTPIISDEHFQQFTPQMATPEHILNNIHNLYQHTFNKQEQTRTYGKQMLHALRT